MPAQPSAHIGLDLRLTYYTGGGIARYIRRLAADLPAADPEHRYTHFYHRGHAESFSTAAHRVECWTPAHHRLERWALAVELWPHRLDLLHSPDFIPPARAGRRCLITVHDLTFLRYPEFLTPDSRRYYSAQIAWAVRRADAIAADSHATEADLVDLLGVPPRKITVIHLGVDAAFTPQSVGDAPALAGLGLSPGYLLFVGTFEPRKNVPGLLQAYARLRAARPDAPPLVLAGRRGWLFETVAGLLRDLHLEDCVQFLTDIPDSRLPAVYRGASAFVLPSHYEGFGFTLLEALACGTPSVIADRASLPEIAGEAALRVNPGDTEAMAAALERVLTDSGLRADLIGRGLTQAKRFTWQRTTAATLALYHNLLAGL